MRPRSPATRPRSWRSTRSWTIESTPRAIGLRRRSTAAGLRHEVKTYPGVDHAFFNDTGGRYDPTQAAAAYADVLAWLREAFGG